MRVFLSYRRADAAGYTGRLHDALVARLGADDVFQDVATIAPGEDFSVALDRALDACDAVLAVIGPGWLTAATVTGRSRLQGDDDYVRSELAGALARGIPVVPVLVGGASPPARDALPEDLRPLALHQAVEVRDESWQRDVDALVRALDPRSGEGARWRRRGVLAAAAVPVVALAVWRLPPPWNRAPDDAGEALPTCEPGRGADWTELDVIDAPAREVGEETGTLAFAVVDGRWRDLDDGSRRVVLDTTMDNRTSDDAYHGDWYYRELIVGRRAATPVCFSASPDLVSAGTVGDARVGFDTPCPAEGWIELVLDDEVGRISVTSEELAPSTC